MNNVSLTEQKTQVSKVAEVTIMDKLRSPMLDVKVVCLLVFFLLSEIGSGKTSPYKTYGALHRNSVPCSRGGAAYYSCLPEKLLDSGYCDPDEGLPCTESNIICSSIYFGDFIHFKTFLAPVVHMICVSAPHA